jgi:SNF2 family DNA or RNA helicase
MRTELRDYQVEAVKKACGLEYVALFADIGTGKTLMTIELLEHWYSLGLRRFIVVAPNAVCGSWLDEAVKWSTPLQFKGLPKTKRAEAVKAQDWDVLVVNYEATRSLWGDIIKMKPQGLAVDESHGVKHRTSGQSKAVRKIAQATRILEGRRAILTGTPMSKDPLGLWSQMDVLHPGPKAFTGYEHVLQLGPYQVFENAVCVTKAHPRLGNRVPLRTFPPERLAPVLATMAPWSIVLRKEDVLADLPLVSDVLIHVDMSDEQQALYLALKKDAIAALQLAQNHSAPDTRQSSPLLSKYNVRPFDPDMIDEDTLTVSAPFMTTLQMRLQQVTSGHIKAEDGTLVRLANAKLQLLREEMPELCDAGDGKLLVFTRFTPDVDDIMRLAEELDIPAIRLDGSTSHDARNIVHRFQTDPAIRVMVANIAVAREGITLTAANTALFYSHSTVPEHRTQARGRIHRIGQTRPVEYREYVARGTVDEHIVSVNTERYNFAVASIKDLLTQINNW